MQYIAGVIGDFSRELGDGTHEAANITQALYLWRQCGSDASSFVTGFLYPARDRTRRAQGAQGAGMITSKMAYFFEILRRLVAATGTAEPADGPAQPPVGARLEWGRGFGTGQGCQSTGRRG